MDETWRAQPVPDETAIELRHFLGAMAAAFEDETSGKGLSLIVEVEPCLPVLVLLDLPRVERVLNNLLHNAVTFTDRGSIVLRAEAAGTGRFKVSVSDTGRGIAPDRQASLFHAGHSENRRGAARYGGTGRGLAICRDLTERMGGRLDVTSALGVGSTFTVTLPLRDASHDDAGRVSSPA